MNGFSTWFMKTEEFLAMNLVIRSSSLSGTRAWFLLALNAVKSSALSMSLQLSEQINAILYSTMEKLWFIFYFAHTLGKYSTSLNSCIRLHSYSRTLIYFSGSQNHPLKCTNRPVRIVYRLILYARFLILEMLSASSSNDLSSPQLLYKPPKHWFKIIQLKYLMFFKSTSMAAMIEDHFTYLYIVATKKSVSTFRAH